MTMLDQDAARRIVAQLTNSTAALKDLGDAARRAAEAARLFGEEFGRTFHPITCGRCNGRIVGQYVTVAQGRNAGPYHSDCYLKT